LSEQSRVVIVPLHLAVAPSLQYQKLMQHPGVEHVQVLCC
jgi:hypothetical protein